MARPIGPRTQLCMSVSARPGAFGVRFHNALYEAMELDFAYKSFAVTDLEGAIRGMRALAIRGAGISMPYKERVIPLLDEIDEAARAIGAVNTVVNDEGRLKGFNTDWIAVRELLAEARIPPEAPVALLGSGGMARAVAYALRDAGLRDVTVVARNGETGPRLARDFGFEWKPEFEGEAPFFLANATPVGMEPNPQRLIPCPEDWLARARVVLDSVGVPAGTELTRRASAAAKRTIEGSRILVIQGREQFRLYTGRSPSPEQLRAAAELATAR